MEDAPPVDFHGEKRRRPVKRNGRWPLTLWMRSAGPKGSHGADKNYDTKGFVKDMLSGVDNRTEKMTRNFPCSGGYSFRTTIFQQRVREFR